MRLAISFFLLLGLISATSFAESNPPPESVIAALASSGLSPLPFEDYQYSSCPRVPKNFPQENAGYYAGNPSEIDEPKSQLYNLGNSCSCKYKIAGGVGPSYLETFTWDEDRCLPYGTDVHASYIIGANDKCAAIFSNKYPTRVIESCQGGRPTMQLIATDCTGGNRISTHFPPRGMPNQIITGPIPVPPSVSLTDQTINEDRQAYLNINCSCDTLTPQGTPNLQFAGGDVAVCHRAGRPTSDLIAWAATYCNSACSLLPSTRPTVASVTSSSVWSSPSIYYPGTGCFNGKQEVTIQVSGPGKVISDPTGIFDCRDATCTAEVCTVPSATNPDNNIGVLPYLNAISDQDGGTVQYSGHQYQRDSSIGRTVTFRPAEVIRPEGAYVNPRPNVFKFLPPNASAIEVILRGSPEAVLKIWVPGSQIHKDAGQLEDSMLVSLAHFQEPGNRIFIQVTKPLGNYSTLVTGPSWAKCTLAATEQLYDHWNCSYKLPANTRQAIFNVSVDERPRELEVLLTGDGTGQVSLNSDSCQKSFSTDRMCNFTILGFFSSFLNDPNTQYTVTPDADSEVVSIEAITDPDFIAISSRGPDSNGAYVFGVISMQGIKGKVKITLQKKKVQPADPTETPEPTALPTATADNELQATSTTVSEELQTDSTLFTSIVDSFFRIAK